MKDITKLQKTTFLVTVIYAAWIRFQDLGYSEYQGDEILTLDFVGHLQRGKFAEYLLTRDKGPLQYIVNLFTYKLTGGLDEFWIRLPYALAGMLFVWVIFEVTRRVAKNNWAGIIAAWLAASNGLFIAFSRITQYQAFVQLLLALTVLILTIERRGKRFGSGAAGLSFKTLQSAAFRVKPWGIGASKILAGLTFGLATLFHYDALTFLAFVGVLFARKILVNPAECSNQASDSPPENPKHEIRNPKQYQNSNVQTTKTTEPVAPRTLGSSLEQVFRILNFCHLDLFRASNFEFRIWRRRLKNICIARTGAVKQALVFLLSFVVVAGAFYLPFFLHPSATSTSGYLAERVFGSGFMPRTLYTEMLMKFYMPKEVLYVLVVLSCLSLYFILKTEDRDSQSVNCKSSYQILNTRYYRCAEKAACYLLPVVLILTFYFSTLWIKPRGSTLVFYFLTAATIGLLFFKKNINQTRASLFAWFLASSCFYLFFNKTPRTHVYIIFIPMFILSGYSLAQFSNAATQLLARLGNWLWPITRVLIKTAAAGVLAVGLVFIPSIYNRNIFVDKEPEYFWGNKTVLGREMIHVEKNLNSKIQGIFGFPQRREWGKIGQLFENKCLTGTYRTNEKNRIPAFYIGEAPIIENADNIILVESPVSWNYQDINKIPEKYTLLKTYSIDDHAVTAIYGKNEVYPNGRMHCER